MGRTGRTDDSDYLFRGGGGRGVAARYTGCVAPLRGMRRGGRAGRREVPL